jgi:hypothetical protein
MDVAFRPPWKVKNAGKEIECIPTLYGNRKDKKPEEDRGKHGIKIRAGYKKAVDSWKLAKGSRNSRGQRAEGRTERAEGREQRSASS